MLIVNARYTVNLGLIYVFLFDLQKIFKSYFIRLGLTEAFGENSVII